MEKLGAEQFAEHIPEVTRVSLNALIERKQDKNRYKLAGIKAALFLIVMFAALMLYTTITKQALLNHFNQQAFQALVSDPLILLLAACLLFGFMQIQYYGKKYQEADDDYEALRYDLIERSEESWPDPVQWRNRHVVFAFMEETYDINLYHK